MLALVFPTEAVLLPNVGKAFLRLTGLFVERQQAGVFDHALLETKEIVATRIGLHRRWVAEQAAEVVEMFLVGGGFLARVTVPLLFEFGGGHGSATNSASFSRLGMGGFYRKTGRSARRLPMA